MTFAMPAHKSTKLNTGAEMPTLGLGTWGLSTRNEGLSWLFTYGGNYLQGPGGRNLVRSRRR